MKANTTAQKPAELLEELRTLVADAEKLLTESAPADAEEAGAALRERFEAAKERLTEAYAVARKKLAAGAKYTDTAIRENPYQALAIALGAGLLAGVLIGRRSKCSD